MTQMAPGRLTYRNPLWPGHFAQVFIGLSSLLELALAVITREAQDDRLVEALLVADGVSTIAAMVAFLTWFRRCRDNAELRLPGSVSYTRGWALGAWFNPLYMWWRPRRIAMDIYRAGVDRTSPDPNGRLINAWWAAWIASIGAPFLPFDAQGANKVLNLIAAVLAIMVIQRITAPQRHHAPMEPALTPHLSV